MACLVSNFPLPPPLYGDSLDKEEHCLKSVQALDKDGRLTPLGRAMAHYPMSPCHSRMLTIIQVLIKKKSLRDNLVLACAVATVFADSHKESHDLNEDGNITVIHKLEKLGRDKQKE
ncbi:unnamed protein product [Malus baccata var. baccata]